MNKQEIKRKKIQIALGSILPKHKKMVAKHREEIARIFTGESDKFLVVVGPCSAWYFDAVREYAEKLAHIQRELKNIKIVMRVYTQKPRTSDGWKGSLFEPEPCKGVNLKKGVKELRKLMANITEMGLAIADEALFLPGAQLLEDYYSYVAIGARSAEDQEHRNFAGTRRYAVCMKNPTSGDLKITANSVSAAQGENFYFNGRELITSSGNPYVHANLRGGLRPNYYKKDMLSYVSIAKEMGTTPNFVVDTNHSNSKKKHEKQIAIVRHVLRARKENSDLHKYCKGVMIESFLQDGNQKLSCTLNGEAGGTLSGLSITDPCLGWDKTQKLLFEIDKLA